MKGALGVMSAKVVIAHTPMPKAWAAREYFAAGKISPTSRSDVTLSSRLRRATFPSRGRLGYVRRYIGKNSAGDQWSPLHFVLVPASYNFPARSATKHDEARPVIAKTGNMSFLIERTNSVQLGGFLRAQALKFPFFLVPFSFGNERKRNSARRANTARLRAITGEVYSENVVTGTTSSERARGYVS